MTHLVCGCCHVRAAAPRASAHSGVQGYSPPPPPVSPIKGLIDFHTHAAPDIFGRALDDDELATLAATRQMEAVVFKNHSPAEDGHRIGLGFGVAGGVGGRPSPEPCLLRAAEDARPHLVARSSAGKGSRVSVFRGGPPPHSSPGATTTTEAR